MTTSSEADVALIARIECRCHRWRDEPALNERIQVSPSKMPRIFVAALLHDIFQRPRLTAKVDNLLFDFI